MGRYITVENTKGCFSLYSDLFSEQIDILSQELRSLIKKIPSKELCSQDLATVLSLPTAWGRLLLKKIFATRHIKRLAKDLDTSDLSDVTVITTGVMAQTGVESSETVKALADLVKPDVIIIADALACSDISHLGTTVQLTDTGISPEAVWRMQRKELSKNTLGVPCIAIGVPTVADMNTIAEGLLQLFCTRRI